MYTQSLRIYKDFRCFREDSQRFFEIPRGSLMSTIDSKHENHIIPHRNSCTVLRDSLRLSNCLYSPQDFFEKLWTNKDLFYSIHFSYILHYTTTRNQGHHGSEPYASNIVDTTGPRRTIPVITGDKVNETWLYLLLFTREKSRCLACRPHHSSHFAFSIGQGWSPKTKQRNAF